MQAHACHGIEVQELFLSFHPVGSRCQMYSLRLGSRHFFPMESIHWPCTFLLKTSDLKWSCFSPHNATITMSVKWQLRPTEGACSRYLCKYFGNIPQPLANYCKDHYFCRYRWGKWDLERFTKLSAENVAKLRAWGKSANQPHKYLDSSNLLFLWVSIRIYIYS